MPPSHLPHLHHFVAEVIDRLEGVHVLLDTSGYGPKRGFQELVGRSDLVFFDLKLMDPVLHQRYTGCTNDLILDNLATLSASGKPFVIRIPLVPGVTDTDQNLESIARTIRGLPGLTGVDLLPYNGSAGSKYRYAGMEFKPDYDETRPLNINRKPFEQCGVKVRVA